MKWAIVIEKASDGSYGGYVSDLPGIGVAGDSVAEVTSRLTEAIEFHLEDQGKEAPASASVVDYVDVEAFLPGRRHRRAEAHPSWKPT